MGKYVSNLVRTPQNLHYIYTCLIIYGNVSPLFQRDVALYAAKRGPINVRIQALPRHHIHRPHKQQDEAPTGNCPYSIVICHIISLYNVKQCAIYVLDIFELAGL